MKYAIVEIAGKQYKVEEGQELIVDRINAQGSVTFDKVLLVVDSDKVNTGSPVLGAKVEAEIMGEKKGKKIRVLKYKAKSRYRKVRGFRSTQTQLKVTRISS